MRSLLKTLLLLTVLSSFPASVQAQIAKETPAVRQVVAAKLMDNYSGESFNSQGLISRAELASIMVRTFGLDKYKVANQVNVMAVQDVKPSHPAFQDIQTVLKTGVMEGYRDNMFFPNQKVTRAEALAIFAQAYGVFQFPKSYVNELLAPYSDNRSIPNWARKAVATLVAERFISTDERGNISPQQPMTRGDLALLLSKYLQRNNINQ
ncbi:MAG: S-layer homology domain-containing protein [Calothrix sp. SM1_7_51]|nr:S-layer homology domain-containing protein [Calothrix sp. SM1_7_51]